MIFEKFSKWVTWRGLFALIVMPFVSGSYMIEVNDYIEKSGLFFQKAKKNGYDDFNPEVNEK